MRKRYIPHLVLEGLKQDITHYRKRKFVLRIVLIVLDEERSEVLVTLSAKDGSQGFPQGKIKRGESALAAVRREAYEELRFKDFVIHELCFVGQAGKKKGRYYYFLVSCKKRPTFTVDPREISGFQWSPPRRALRTISHPTNGRKKKRALSTLALRSALNL